MFRLEESGVSKIIKMLQSIFLLFCYVRTSQWKNCLRKSNLSQEEKEHFVVHSADQLIKRPKTKDKAQKLILFSQVKSTIFLQYVKTEIRVYRTREIVQASHFYAISSKVVFFLRKSRVTLKNFRLFRYAKYQDIQKLHKYPEFFYKLLRNKHLEIKKKDIYRSWISEYYVVEHIFLDMPIFMSDY